MDFQILYLRKPTTSIQSEETEMWLDYDTILLSFVQKKIKNSSQEPGSLLSGGQAKKKKKDYNSNNYFSQGSDYFLRETDNCTLYTSPQS